MIDATGFRGWGSAKELIPWELFFFSSRRRHTRCSRDGSSDVCSSDLLLGTKVEAGDDMVEGYDVFIGGGAGAEQRLGRPLLRAIPFPDLAARLERVLRA